VTPGERFRRVRDIADAALDHPEAGRATFLADACAGSETLRAEVDALLAAYAEVHGRAFLETPAAEIVDREPPTADEDPGEGAFPPGTRIGAYELGDAVGQGGMGVVYRAVRADDEYRQVVAIKVIRRGMDTSFGQRRFREERQILATLEHPGIARLLDGGTTDQGLPYLVMEYVEGEPIDGFCNRRRLGVRDRLRLFVKVCAAVHHAHRSLVVHRDLKPGNVLVTSDGVPKLLDFGIARLIRPAGEPAAVNPTVTMLRMLTPDYASPEQVRGEPVTTATDVYSLGVLLYELLSGQRPYRTTGHAHEVLAAICDQDPERPSASVTRAARSTTAETPALLRKKLAGDLDTIVLKALRKAPNERYASVEALADDITRHLDGRPVRARPHTFAYGAGKFVRRNRAAVVAAGLAVAALLGGIAATLRQVRIAEANRARAEKRFDDVRQLANALLFGIHDSVKELPGSTPARELIVSHALKYLDSLSREVGADRELERELASAYERVGDVQGRPSFPNLGDTRGALASYAKALALREAVAARDPGDAEGQRELATTCMRIGAAQNVIGGASEALASYQRALDILNRMPGAAAGRDLVVAEIRVGDGLARVGRRAESLAHYRSAVARAEALADGAPGPQSQRDLGNALQKLGDALALEGDAERSLAIFRRIHALDQVALAANPQSVQARRNLATSHYEIGRMLLALGHMDAAVEQERAAVAQMEALARADPKNAWAQADVSETTATLGDALAGAGRAREALDAYRRAAAIDEARVAADPANQEAIADRADRHARLGDLLARTGDRKSAVASYRTAVPAAEALVKADPANVEHQRLLARLYTGVASARGGGCAEAGDWYRRAAAVWSTLDGMGTPSTWEAERRKVALDGVRLCSPPR
jgi:non-specific serine/threonine protein kinase/serine/threonine-protein kinase